MYQVYLKYGILSITLQPFWLPLYVQFRVWVLFVMFVWFGLILKRGLAVLPGLDLSAWIPASASHLVKIRGL